MSMEITETPTRIRSTLKSWLEAGVSAGDIEMVLAAAKRDVDFSNSQISAAARKTEFAGRIEAMNSSRYAEKELRLALGQLRSLDLEPNDEGRVSMSALNAALTEKKLEPERRIQIKTILAAAKIID